MRDVMMLEFTTRVTSLMLRHNVPIEFIVEQFSKVNGVYLYSLPLQISNVLKNYLKNEENKECFEQCPQCGQNTLKNEGGCCNCINEDCLYSKCEG